MVGKSNVQLHNRTRRRAHLIIGKYGEKHKCSICKRPTYALRYSTRKSGNRKEVEVARYCEEHEIIFPLKRKVISVYEGASK